ncbi:molecular chaperone [Acerihabitans sp. KWT182]|uniref:Molecular chaperone n=1 Tax=Acerihabitans sp. KWT182 TaxID=3157919 RepID=A0AAU7Q6I0_9GAMM
MNDFSMVCRVLGTLFYRSPQDEILAPLMTLIMDGKLTEHWPLDQDDLLARLGKGVTPTALAKDYSALFDGAAAKVQPFRSSWLAAPESDVRAFLSESGMPLAETPADHFGTLLLAASWLEDHAQQDETIAQIRLFDEFLMPWSDIFLGKVEANAGSDFYRVLAMITREALQALREELAEASA